MCRERPRATRTASPKGSVVSHDRTVTVCSAGNLDVLEHVTCFAGHMHSLATAHVLNHVHAARHPTLPSPPRSGAS
eukprot:CAMPEP_0174753020 /NCGR_PEP_ID=MMETSP1094-20130205/103268_1 /TAXON_ID=156173 /ORGANISM="Chrysochromulina brevifilum, Strain UTEX LB 985" /LENGTH=75 /DNA_ID=CAMNT_0015958727 /DNA_START=56 /DNA_END=283 /DNA_ORIENTATION=-